MTPPAPAADQPGLVEDLVDIFASPAKVFARRAKAGGAAAFFTVAIVLSAIAYSGKTMAEPIAEAQGQKAMAAAQAKNPSLTADQMQAGMAFQRKLLPVFLVVGPPIAMVILGVFVWIVGKSFGAAITFGSSMMITAFAYIPRIIGGVVADVQGLMTSDLSTLTSPTQISLSPARFLDPATTGAAMLQVLMRFDLMTIWATVLIGVGYAAAGKLPKGKAATAAIVLWVLGSLPTILGALRTG